MERLKCFSLSLSFFKISFQVSHAKGTLSIQFVDYNNPSSRDNAGSCCDCCSFFGYCPNKCDNFFRLYAVPYPVNHYGVSSAWNHWETHVMSGGDSFSFPGYGQSLGNHNNPVTYHFNGRWQVKRSML